jgi:hypothetical protein
MMNETINQAYCSIRPEYAQLSHDFQPEATFRMIAVLPFFDEEAADLPPNSGIEHSHDGGWYPYSIEPFVYLKDTRGLDLRCYSRAEALEALEDEAE